jgi:hypothetical protein
MITSQRSQSSAMVRTEHLWSALLEVIHINPTYSTIFIICLPHISLSPLQRGYQMPVRLRHSLSSMHISSLFPPTTLIYLRRETQSNSWNWHIEQYPLMSVNCTSVLQILLLSDDLTWAHLSALWNQ